MSLSLTVKSREFQRHGPATAAAKRSVRPRVRAFLVLLVFSETETINMHTLTCPVVELLALVERRHAKKVESFCA